MNYVVFESGSRAGLSAELFFKKYVAQSGDTASRLLLSDLDRSFTRLESTHPQVSLVHDSVSIPMLTAGDAVVFPADELTRQTNDAVRQMAQQHGFSYTESRYYNKREMNLLLAERTAGAAIRIPPTFAQGGVCVRPNTRSAGSRNVQFLDNECVTMLVDIESEFVVDVLRYSDELMYVFPREVTLKNGYDRFIRLHSTDGPLAQAVREFVTATCPRNEGMFSNIFHLQLCRGKDGNLYYIEFSKRISGTSCVNIATGMSPFALIAGMEQSINTAAIDGRWHRFEDFLIKGF